MAFSSSGAMGAVNAYEGPSYRLARDLRAIQKKRGWLSYEAIIERGWSEADIQKHISTAIQILRGMCLSHWPTCPSTIVIDANLTLLLTETRQ